MDKQKFSKIFINSVLCGCAFMVAVLFCLIDVKASDGYVCDHGYHTFGDYTLNGGVGNYGYTRRYYWISNLDDNYCNYVNNAVDLWVNTDVFTPIAIQGTDVQSDSSFDIYEEYLGRGVLGMTLFWRYSNSIDITSDGALSENYGWTQIKLSSSVMNGQSDEQKIATIEHEFGHAMGLSHNSVGYSIMCQLGDGRYATSPSDEDLNAINHLYE